MRTVEVMSNERKEASVWLHVPDGWDAFVYRGYLYVLMDGRFQCVEKLP